MVIKNIESGTVKFNRGEIIFNEGEKGDVMYIIKGGKVQLVKYRNNQRVTLDVLYAKDFFGEMAIFDQGKRVATAVAIEPTELIVVDKSMLKKTLDSVPGWFMVMFKTLIKRLKEMDERIVNQ